MVLEVGGEATREEKHRGAGGKRGASTEGTEYRLQEIEAYDATGTLCVCLCARVCGGFLFTSVFGFLFSAHPRKAIFHTTQYDVTGTLCVCVSVYVHVCVLSLLCSVFCAIQRTHGRQLSPRPSTG